MKKLLFVLFAAGLSTAHAATDSLGKTARLSVGVLNIDAHIYELNSLQAGNMVRLELEKLNVFDVIDRYDVSDLVAKNNISLDKCYGRNCVTQTGILLGADRMISGTIEKLGQKIVITFRYINVREDRVDNQLVNEFLYLPERLPEMVSLTLRELLKLPSDEGLKNKLTVNSQLESAQNNPKYDRLRSDGPRFGVTVLTGTMADVFTRPEEEGGFNGYPAMFIFGYQFEVQYLNEGRFQGLFEFIPMINGLDQGKFIPSLSILHGMRDNKSGWEMAFGPVVYGTPMARGYFSNDTWHLEDEWTDSLPNPHALVNRVDSRGEIKITSGFVIAMGRTFRSGKLNMPVNLFAVSSPYGMRYGFSMGFNVKSHEQRPGLQAF